MIEKLKLKNQNSKINNMIKDIKFLLKNAPRAFSICLYNTPLGEKVKKVFFESFLPGFLKVFRSVLYDKKNTLPVCFCYKSYISDSTN